MAAAEGKGCMPAPTSIPPGPVLRRSPAQVPVPGREPSQEVQISRLSRLRLGHVTTVRVARRLGVRVVRTREASTNKQLRKRARVGES